jgi:hypothetical protein
MNEFKQFRDFLPGFWQEDGILVEAVRAIPERNLRRRLRMVPWKVAMAGSAVALACVITLADFSLPVAGAARRASVEERALTPISESPFAEVSPEHWARVQELVRTFERTPLMDEFHDPEVPS